jgi:phage terminase small subunit
VKRGDLSPKQRKVLDAYAKGAMLGRGTLADAARAGGHKGKEAALAVTASRLLKKPAAAAYVADLKRRALAKAEEISAKALAAEGREHAAKVDFVAEALAVKRRIMHDVNAAHIGSLMRADGTVDIEAVKATPPGVVRKLSVKSTTDAEGQVYAQHEVALEPLTTALQAASGILQHFRTADAPPSGGDHRQQAIVLVMGEEGRELLRQAARLLGSGGKE